MSKRLIGEFVSCVEAKPAAATAEVSAGKVKGFSLFLSSVISIIAEFFRRLFGGGSNEE